MKGLEACFPWGVEWLAPCDGSTIVSIFIEQVALTLIEAIVLVFLAMWSTHPRSCRAHATGRSARTSHACGVLLLRRNQRSAWLRTRALARERT